MFILAISLFSALLVPILLSLPYCITAPVHFTVVTPSNVLVPPLWHFILLHHPLPSAFPSRHTGITLIMIMAVMIMITTAKLHSLSLISNTQEIMIDWKAACKCFPHLIFSAFLNLSSSFFCFILLFSCFPRSLHSLFILQLTSCLFSVFVKFLPVFHLCCCAPFNLSWCILPPPLVPSSLLSQSWFSALTSSLLCLSTLLLSILLILLPQRKIIHLMPYCIQEIIIDLPCLLNMWSGHGCIIYDMYKTWTCFFPMSSSQS